MLRKIKFFIIFLILSISSLSACDDKECDNLEKITNWLNNEIERHKESSEFFFENAFEYFYLIGQISEANRTLYFIESLND